MLVVITANYRGYDEAHLLPPGAIVYSEVRRENAKLDGRYLGKGPKCAPHLLGHTDPDVVWVDGSMQWTRYDPSLRSLIDQVPVGGVGMFAHRYRDCIYDEAKASLPVPGFIRYKGEPILQQVEHYRTEGHPAHSGLWECGIIVWRGAQYVLGPQWLAEQLVWSSQDQISLPVVARRRGVTITTLSGGDVVNNRWFRYVEHKRGAEV